MNKPILNRNFQHPADGWYHIEAIGEHPNAEAGVVQVIDAAAVESIVNRFNAAAAAGKLSHGHEMLIDHEHFKHDSDKETRAFGWLTRLENRADGIYGQIRWTATGKPAVDGGDYRFFSTEYAPADLEEVGGVKNRVRPLALDGLTLTNEPNNKGQRPITNRIQNRDDEGGHWVTVNGAHILIHGDESVEGALHRNAQEDESDDKSVPTVHTLRDPSGAAHHVTIVHDGKNWVIKNPHGETLGRKFTSRSDAKQFANDKLQKEVDRRYHQSVADGTFKNPDPKGEVWERQRRWQAEAEAQKAAWSDFFKKRGIKNREALPDEPATPPAGEPEADKAKMKKIAEKLGLSAEASEDAVLDKIEELVKQAKKANKAEESAEGKEEKEKLKNRLSQLETELFESELDAAGITEEGTRKGLLPALQVITNRADRKKFLEGLGTRKPAASAPLTNRATAKTPGAPADGQPDPKEIEKQGVAIRNRASDLQKANPKPTTAGTYRSFAIAEETGVDGQFVKARRIAERTTVVSGS